MNTLHLLLVALVALVEFWLRPVSAAILQPPLNARPFPPIVAPWNLQPATFAVFIGVCLSPRDTFQLRRAAGFWVKPVPPELTKLIRCRTERLTQRPAPSGHSLPVAFSPELSRP